MLDLLVKARSVITMDSSRDRVKCLGVSQGRIVAAGSLEEVQPLAGPRTRHVDLGDAVCVPGFIDVHMHLLSFGLTLGYLDLTPTAVHRLEDILRAVRQRAAVRSQWEWIIGRGYDHNQLPEARHPTRTELDQAAPNHPVALLHVSGHFTVVNSTAVTIAEIPEDHPPQEHGSGGQSRFSGLLEETAQTKVARFVYRRSVDEAADAIAAAGKELARVGVTTVHDAGVGRVSDEEIGAYQIARDRNQLSQRTVLMVRWDALNRVKIPWALGARTGFGDARLRIGSAKIVLDGSILGQTAALDIPYPGSDKRGGFLLDEEEFRSAIRGLHRAGWQCAIHAVGDRAVRVAVEAIEDAQAAFPRPDPRHRIEHCGLVTRDLIDRIVTAGIIPVPQPAFIDRLGDGFLRVLGSDRTRFCYVLRSFLDAGLPIPGSSDAPVASAAPLHGIHSAVIRRTRSGISFHPEEALTVGEALAMYTRHSAGAGFDEGYLGMLRAGYCADFVALDDDPTRVDPDAIPEIKVRATYVGGRATFEA